MYNLQLFKSATLLIIWKKLHESCMNSALHFAQAVHTSPVSHSQFDKHLIMPPLSVAVMPPKKSMYFLWPVAIVPLVWI
jgi:hypothetical protein